MENRIEKKLPGWAVALLVIFYPVGLIYLLCRWMNKNKDAFTQKSNIMTVIGVFLLFCAVIYLIAGLTGNVQSDDPEEIFFGIIMMLIVCFVGGIALLIYGSQFRKLGRLYGKYASVILGEELESIDEIATVSGTGYEIAVADIQKLIDKGGLPGRYIDHRKRILVWLDKPHVKEPVKKAIICPHCGGSNTIIMGQPAACAYCDSPLQ